MDLEKSPSGKLKKNIINNIFLFPMKWNKNFSTDFSWEKQDALILFSIKKRKLR